MAEDKSAGGNAEGIKPIVTAISADGETAGTGLRGRGGIRAGGVSVDGGLGATTGISACDAGAESEAE